MKVGYARVSTQDQSLDLQLAALLKCDRIFREHESGAQSERPELKRCLDALRPKDVLVVWRLDRLGRSLRDLVAIAADLQSRDIQFQSLSEAIDTTTPSGRLVFHVFGALAEFERELIRERSKAGMKAAIARGVHIGRPPLPPKKINAVDRLTTTGVSVAEACSMVGCSRSAYYRGVKRGHLLGTPRKGGGATFGACV